MIRKTGITQRVLFACVGIILSSSMHAESPLSENRELKFLSVAAGKPEKEIVASKSHHWVTYKQTFGAEHLQVKFPKAPTIDIEKDVVFTYFQKKKILYSMVAFNPPRGGVDPDEAFPLAIATLCQHPSYLLGYKISVKEGQNILDTTSQDYYSGAITKSRLIITKHNYYILKTHSPSGEKGEHDYFINSFSIHKN